MSKIIFKKASYKKDIILYNKNITGGILEEKLYFAPANYGKGAKRAGKSAKALATPRKSKEKKNHKILKLVGFLLLIAAIIIVLIWLLHGNTTTTGQYPENIKNESLSCISTTAVYEKVNKKIADKRELKINAVFYGKEKLSSIGLRYTQEFTTNADAYAAEAITRAQFGKDLQDMGYEHSRFHNKFSLMDNILVVTLQSDANEIDDLARDYFLIKSDNPPTNIQEYRANYESQGFACTSTIDNN